MSWRKKTRVEIPDDLGLARALRKQATREIAQLKRQAPYVSRLTARLVERRELNHFGDELSITFTPKGRHA